jgi:hypothetical protein
MARIAVAWNPKLTPAQVSNLNELLARGANVTPADAEAALLRGAARPEPPRGSGGGGGGGPVGGIAVEPLSPAGQARNFAMAGAAQMLLAKSISNLQSAEQAKALARLAELGPEIGRLMDANYAVTVTVEVEVPKTVNIAGVATQSDPSMIVYYRNMYIDQAVPILPNKPPDANEPPAYHATGEISEKYGNPRRWEDHHDYTLDQQIREQMGDPDPTGADKPLHPTHRVMKRSQTLTPQALQALPTARPRPAAAPPKPEPKLDPETAKKLAEAPTRVYLLSGNVVQYKTAARVREKLSTVPVFRVTGEATAGGGGSSTRVVYWSEYDRPRAEKLAEWLRAEGLPAAKAESGGGPDQAPGYVQINFGRDAEQ